jgi:hypothetical protein
VVLSRAQMFKHYVLSDIEWMVMPPVFGGQFLVLEATDSVRGFSVLAVTLSEDEHADVDKDRMVLMSSVDCLRQ